MNAEKLAQQLKKEANLSNQEIRKQTKQKMDEYEGLVTSKDAAVILVGKEYNIDLVELNRPKLEIANIEPDIDNATVTAKIDDIDKFSYKKDGEKRKACDVTLRDDTGEISLMLWGDQVENVDGFSSGDLVRLSSAYSNEYQGDVQLGWSSNTGIKKK